MDTRLSQYWWLVLLQGIAAVIYGILAFIWPAITLEVFILFFGIFAIVYGVSAVIDAFGNRASGLWWLELIDGIVAVIVGVLAFIWPGVTALSLLYLVIVWALVVGVFEIVAATRSYFPSQLRWAFGLAGIASILVGVLLFAIGPARGLLALIWLIGLHALFNGVIWIYRAFQLRRLHHEECERGGPVPA